MTAAACPWIVPPLCIDPMTNRPSYLEEAHHHCPERLEPRDGPEDPQRPQRPQRPDASGVASDREHGDVPNGDHGEVKRVPRLPVCACVYVREKDRERERLRPGPTTT